MSRRFVIGLALIAGVGLAIRVYFVLVGYDYYRIGGDAYYYHLQGNVIADGKWFIDPGRWYFNHTHIEEPSAAHPPLYGLYLGVVSFLGFDTVTQHRLASTLLGTAAVVVIGLTGRRIAGERMGLIAAAIAAVYAYLWINDGMLLSESMSILTASLVLLAAYSLWRKQTMANAVWLGLAFGLAALSRSEILIAAPILTLPLILGMRTIEMAKRWLMVGVVALCMGLLVGPWVVYNLTRFEKPVLLTDSTWSVMGAASCDRSFYGELKGWYSGCYNIRVTGRDASEREDKIRPLVTDYLSDHLSDLPEVMLARIGRLTEFYRPTHTFKLNVLVEGRTVGASRLGWITYVLLLPCAIAGTIVMRKRKIPISPFIALVVSVTVAAALTFGVLRYRVTAEPALVLAAAYAIDLVWNSMTRHRSEAQEPVGELVTTS